MRWLRRILVGLAVVVVVVALAGVWLVRRSFPQIDGEVTVPGLDSTVTVTRDAEGIPHIEAETSHDLFMAQGYVHAQDRFWQMDVWRHIGAGRLSEMFGAGQVETDSFLRTLGFERVAEEEYARAPEEAREALDAYAQGVNAYLDERPGGAALSLEYAVLGFQSSEYRPEDWDPVDSLTWAHVMAWDLRANLEEEIDRAIISGVVGRDRTEQLYPPYPTDHPVIVPSGAHVRHPDPAPQVATDAAPALDEVADRIEAVDEVVGDVFEGIGSNSWVVDGSRTSSGSPILANDPHLGIQMPSIWYEIDLWCGETGPDCPYRVTGFSFPGTPGVVIGHNERIAWGVTNLGPDTMDLYIERTDGADRYEVDGTLRPMDVRTEVIEVAGGDDVEIEVRSTRHGPIISGRYGALDEFDGAGVGLPDDHEIALRWQALEPSTLLQSILRIDRSRSWDEFREGASSFDIAAQNLVYADVDGHIGYQATGEIPIRTAGDGRYPVPGWTGEYEWDGFVPFEDLPSMLDPPSGVIVTANQPVVDDGYDAFIGIDHSYGYRAERITRLLEDSGPMTAHDMVSIQMDEHDGSAPTVVEAVLDLPAEGTVGEIQDILRPWLESGAQMGADSPGAAVYAAVWRHLLADTFDDELPEGHGAGGGSRFFHVVDRLLEYPGDEWWDDVGTDAVETAPDVVATAVRSAHAELTERLGEDPGGWRWADLHRASFENGTLGQSGIAPIEALFNRTAPSEVGGGSSIVNATGWVAPEGYGVIAVPSMRMVVDLGDLSRSVSINTTGQSGHAYHAHYFDMVKRWAEGGTHPMWFGPDSIDDPEGRLRLVPGDAAG